MPRTRRLLPRQPAPPFRKNPSCSSARRTTPVGSREARAERRRVLGGRDPHRQHSAGAPGSVRWETRG
eukprot:7849966-Alexandrium_andersonii.AAC.1